MSQNSIAKRLRNIKQDSPTWCEKYTEELLDELNEAAKRTTREYYRRARRAELAFYRRMDAEKGKK